MHQAQREVWASGNAYEPYVGRWSRLVAREFVEWLGLQGGRWLDVGCGTGALSQTIRAVAEPVEVHGLDPSAYFVAFAEAQTSHARASFKVGDARSLPYEAATFDAAVSGLVLNFMPQPDQALSKMVRIAEPGATVAAYIWDYAGKIELMRYFWDAVVRQNPTALPLDEGQRFPLCQLEPLTDLFYRAGLWKVEARAIDVPTFFHDFDDYWLPFLGGQGAAPGYAMSLSDQERSELREFIRADLPIGADGSIHLIARAWAVQGRCG